jgi:hypothetical protein
MEVYEQHHNLEHVGALLGHGRLAFQTTSIGASPCILYVSATYSMAKATPAAFGRCAPTMPWLPRR